MTKLEKVIDGFERCFQGTYEICKECQYHEFYPHGCNVERDQDALELLKAQEPKVMPYRDAYAMQGKCPNCGKWCNSNSNFCWNCGQAVKWDDEA